MYFQTTLKMTNILSVILLMILQLCGIMAAPTERTPILESICQDESSTENGDLVKPFLNDLKIKLAILKQTAQEVQNEYDIARRLTDTALKSLINDMENSPRESFIRFSSINVTEMLMEDHERFESMQHSLELRLEMETSDLIKNKMRTTFSTLQEVLHDIRLFISILRPGASPTVAVATEETRLQNTTNDQIRYIRDYILLNNLLRLSEVVIQKYTDINDVKFCI